MYIFLANQAALKNLGILVFAIEAREAADKSRYDVYIGNHRKRITGEKTEAFHKELLERNFSFAQTTVIT